MFVPIGNTPRDYAWGSATAIAGLLGRPASGRPEAELWLGAHAGSPSVILDPARAGGARDLAEWIAMDPATALGDRVADGASRLPFLLKILAAGAPLSLQAHPSPQRARIGFARENALGIPLDAAGRNYKDAYHKPELIYALSDRFDALCGFRAVAESERIVAALVGHATVGHATRAAAYRRVALEGLRARLIAASADQADGLREVVAWLLGRGPGVEETVAAVVAAASSATERSAPDQDIALFPEPAERPGAGAFARELATVRQLALAYPGDPGIVLSLLLNRVTLRSGEALYLPAGNIHAYLAGLGVELMAASDNVLRGGLTPKHVDVPELLEVLDFAAVPVPYLHPERPVAGLQVFRPDVPDFVLARVDVGDAKASAEEAPMASVALAIGGPAIAICTAGHVELAGDHDRIRIARGESVYATPDESVLRCTGGGTAFVATTNGG